MSAADSAKCRSAACSTARGCARWTPRHGGSIIDAQIARAVADDPWPPELAADVAAVTVDDFELVPSGADAASGHHIDDSLDLIAIAVAP